MTPTNYVLYRKLPDDTTWGTGVTLAGSTTSFTDNNVEGSRAYEYRVVKNSMGYRGYGYVRAGAGVPLVDYRGKLVLLVESSLSSPLATELARLQQDLVGDGWQVLRHDVSWTATVQEIKDIIRGDYYSDTANVHSLFLIGHVPVPYSGDISPDDHNPEHRGAWPADSFYGDMDGTWTDSTVTSIGSSDPRNHNTPGDGKFDQSLLPSDVDLEVGRVDLSNLPGRREFEGPATFPSEIELTRQYLNKDHAFKHKLFSVPQRAVVSDNFGLSGGLAYAAGAYRGFSPLVGPTQTYTLIQPGYWVSELANNPYLLAYGCGSGTYETVAGLGWEGTFNELYSTDLVDADIKTVVAMIYGSYFGDWDSEDNLLRAALACPNYTLAAIWSGTPHWFIHPMALGQTIGYCTRLTQNNRNLYQQVNPGTRQVHVSLMGDPSLRLHVVSPPANVNSYQGQSNSVILTWNSSSDAVEGYHVYRAQDAAGPYLRLTTRPSTGLSFKDPNLPPGSYTYMIRAVQLEQTPSGSYTNASQGLFTTVAIVDISLDSDQDGASDMDERAAGTDPYNAGSVMKCLGLSRTSGGGFKITWASVPGKSYQVLFRPGLAAGAWSNVSGNISAATSKTEWTDNLRSSQGFYRVSVVP
ncbi:MAG: hypothetical protein JWM16_4582 [Verrucomicrobiales bacterium]|nr:hypothetical protein [Verrucomicrobiales bacterium]